MKSAAYHLHTNIFLMHLLFRNCSKITCASCLSFLPIVPVENPLHSPLCAGFSAGALERKHAFTGHFSIFPLYPEIPPMLLTFEYPRFFRMPIARLLRLPRRQYRKIGVSLEIDRLNLSITESGMFTAPGMRPEEYSSFSLTSIRRAPSVCLYSDRPLVISDLKNILQSYLTLSAPASHRTL